MIKELWVYRHSYTNTNSIKQKDIDRSLSDRGIEVAIERGAYLRNHNIFFDIVIHSPAARVIETLQYTIDRFYLCNEYYQLDSIYTDNAHKIFIDLIKVCDKKNISKVLLIGHEPYCSKLVYYLTGNEVENFIEASIVKIIFQDKPLWSDIHYGDGKFIEVL